MSEDVEQPTSELGRWERHRFLVMIAAVIAAALFLVGIALGLYASSGTAQLDLSRPGYQSVRQQASQTENYAGFPSNGSLTIQSLDEFRKLYNERTAQVGDDSSFAGEALSDESLGISFEPAEPVAEGQ